MNTVYQNAINQLSQYLEIPGAKDSVNRAIGHLQRKKISTAIYVELEKNAAPLLDKLANENEICGGLSALDKLKYIVHEFLISQGFTDESPETYSLTVLDCVYNFKIRFMDDDSVFMGRSKQGNRRPRSAAYCVDELPSLKVNERKADVRILKTILKGLRCALKRSWKHLHLDRTPSASDSQETDIEDIIINEELSCGE